MSQPEPITVGVTLQATAEQAWRAFTDPAAIQAWNFANADWHCPRAENDLREGGAFNYRMEARDGSFGFDMEGTFVAVEAPRRLRYAMGPEREVRVELREAGGLTQVDQSFTPESTHPLELQRAGWQAILDNYKAFVERAADPR